MQTRVSKDSDREVRESLEPLIKALGMSLIELSLFRGKGRSAGNVQVKLVVQTALDKNMGITGLEDCSRVHKAVMPRLELIFAERDIHLEVSSPGIDRLIKDREELHHYIGREIRCYRSDISDWSKGTLTAVEDYHILLNWEGSEICLSYDVIAKARLCVSPLPGRGG